MNRNTSVWQIAVPSPIYKCFDYLPSAGSVAESIQPGSRVLVPFGRGTRIGMLVGVSLTSEIPIQRLKQVSEVLDDAPILPPELLKLLRWAAEYYHHPPGEVVIGALPGLLRRGGGTEGKVTQLWHLTEAGRKIDPTDLRKAPRQRTLLQQLIDRPEGWSPDEIIDTQHRAALRTALRAFHSKGWVSSKAASDLPQAISVAEHETAPTLNADQRHALEAIHAAQGRFQTFLLDGVTGSGKTEVYFRLIETLIRSDRQILLLVPEIGLTPQIIERIQRRFTCSLSLLHSGRSERERLEAWVMAAEGRSPIIVGTRSAIFTPIPRLGAIIVDEEHDGSYKQQEGFRYHARDIAVVRAQRLGIPVILGSATPSLESLQNSAQGRYQPLVLSTRAGAAAQPTIRLIDLRTSTVEDGVSDRLAMAIDDHLARGNQILLFLNRRGYAPTLFCEGCRWVASCQRCDAHMIVHRIRHLLRCHHCGAQNPVPATCPRCGGPALVPLGQGTERVEESLSVRYPAAEIIRIDRDSTRRKGAMETLIKRIRNGKQQILLGTQMLAKGHHLPNVTLAGLLDVDQGLFGADYRASERIGQLIIQVAGRAGRANKPGEVLIQTRCPEHPLLQALLSHDYQRFAGTLLEERRQAGMPPWRCMALLRAESVRPEAPIEFLESVRKQAGDADGVDLLGPAPAPMERRAGRYRAQLLLLSAQRTPLHHLLSALTPRLDGLASAGRVRWSLDIDPTDEF